MKTKIAIQIVALILFLVSCNNNNTSSKVTDASEYDTYLAMNQDKKLDDAKEENSFWTEKLEKSPSQYPYHAKLAGSHSQLFQATGNISHLVEAARHLEIVNERTNNKNAGYLRSLARNYISQHRFQEALELLQKAEENGERLHATQKMLFDVHLEVGNTAKAKEYLQKFENSESFDALIRMAKWYDHEGKLMAAIKMMEKAKMKAEEANSTALKQWSYTNLADFYGHAGRIKDAYTHYLKALELDPNDAYAKKGIAWIAFSHEKNPEEALRILNTIMEKHKAPDYYLLKAEIADYMNDKAAKEKNIDAFLSAIENTDYGVMYTSYQTTVLAEERQEFAKALQIAQKEVSLRPTPQAYDLLAWTYHLNGNSDKALAIMKKHVIGKTFEPVAMYHVAEVQKANGNNKEAVEIKEELLESSFELGPVMMKNIQRL